MKHMRRFLRFVLILVAIYVAVLVLNIISLVMTVTLWGPSEASTMLTAIVA
jgi:hypothetical protein